MRYMFLYRVSQERQEVGEIFLRKSRSDCPPTTRMTPTQRSLKKLRSEGWFVALTEHWNPFAKVKQDLFGFIDILAIRGDETLAVQTTSGDHVSHRLEKINACQAASFWRESPTRKIVIHGWRKVGSRGKRKTWKCREVPVP